MKELKSIMLAGWLLFIVYAFFLAPVQQGDRNYLLQLLTLDSPDPLLVTVFSLLGVWPMIFAILLLAEDRASIPAWPFVLLSFGLGAFALLPYFIFHEEDKRGENRTSERLQHLLKGSTLPLTLLMISVALLLYGFIFGDFDQYRQAFWTSRFVHTMTIDFGVLTLLSLLGISHHAYYHKRINRRNLWGLGWIPVIGPLIYLFMVHKSE